MWPLCSAQILVDGVNPQHSYFWKYLCNRTTYECFIRFSMKVKSLSSNQHLRFLEMPFILTMVHHMSVSFVPLRNSRVHLPNNTFILRKVVENLCDRNYQKYCKVVVSKEVCLHHVTLSLWIETTKPSGMAESLWLINKVYKTRFA